VIRPVGTVMRKTEAPLLATSLSHLARQNLAALYFQVQMSIVKGFHGGKLDEMKMRQADSYTRPQYYKYLINPFIDAPLERGKFMGKDGRVLGEHDLQEIVKELVDSTHFREILDHVFRHVLPKMKDNGRWIRQQDWEKTAEHFLMPNGQEEVTARYRKHVDGSFSSADALDDFQ
jgi:hypothetical protein